MMDENSGAGAALRDAVSYSRRVFLYAGIFGLFINLLVLAGPLYMLQIYDRVLQSGSVPTLVALTVLVGGLYITLGILDWLRQVIFTEAGSRFEETLSRPAMDTVIRAHLRDPGQPAGRTLGSLRVLRQFFAGQTLPALFDLPFSILFFLVLFLMHWAYGVWAVFGAIVLFALALLNRRLSSERVERSEELDRASQRQSSEIANNVEVMEAMGMRAPLLARWETLIDQADESLRRSNVTIGAFAAGTKVFRLFLQSAILGLGAYLTIIGQSTAGAMIAASILMGRAIGPIQQVVGQWRSIVSAHDSWRQLRGVLEDLEPRDEPMALPPIKGRLQVQNVYAAPPNVNDNTLRAIDFDLEPGEVLGLLGRSASGKSSLARVMVGLWPTRHGTVRIDGAELAGFSREQLGPQIGYLPQHVELLSGSVIENISRFDPEMTPEKVLAAAEAAGCHDMILGLNEGYATQVGSGGVYISSGQRQRIGLARALYGEPNFVVLDEPNANLDTAGDQAMLNALERLKARGATTVIIAHRPNAIVHCDKLLVLEAGEVKAFGGREEILPKIMPKGAVPVTSRPDPKRAADEMGGS
jgi:PrtD family type I secretion system ABC transporter